MHIPYLLETRITPLTTFSRERILPAKGEVFVHPGQQVAPSDVVARCLLPGRLWTVDTSQALGVGPEQATRYLRKAVGDTVQADEVLAERSSRYGWLQRSCRSPVTGQLVAIRRGQALISAETTTFELFAHIRGRVTSVIPNRGAVLSAVGALIQGMWGNSAETSGLLKVGVEDPQEPLGSHSFEEDCRGTLIVGGRLLDGEVLERATEARVRGLIFGSVSARLCPLIQQLSYPVLVTEPFGSRSMCRQAFSLLQSCTGQKAMLTAGTQTPGDGRRPEVLVPLEAEWGAPPEELAPPPLEMGMSVRGLRAPYLGAVGSITALPPVPQLLETGARLPVAQVALEGGGSVLIPLANLELIR